MDRVGCDNDISKKRLAVKVNWLGWAIAVL